MSKNIVLIILLVAVVNSLAVEFDNLVIPYAQYGACCIDQDPPITKVVKLMVQVRTRTVTQQQKVAAKCGVFGWDICTRYTNSIIPQQYYVQLYTHNTEYPPCNRFSCCHGFQQVLDKCIVADKFKEVVTLLADYRDKHPDIDLKTSLAGILEREKILG
ncbi:uncharacterized protein [Watersipora subatra]|uniref:uncharacterized protein n=1 Tax=Watersipora subatra TaxID=2589382 RepID=UPI00355BF9C4